MTRHRLGPEVLLVPYLPLVPPVRQVRQVPLAQLQHWFLEVPLAPELRTGLLVR